MEVTVMPGIVNGAVQAIPSKSVSQRALAAALLRSSVTFLKGIGNAADEQIALQLIQQLGAEIHVEQGGWIKIVSKFPVQKNEPILLNCGESGLALRMFTPIAALSDENVEILGEGSLLSRPLLFSKKLFEKLNVCYTDNKGSLPVKLNGPLRRASITLDGSISSQLLSGLLFAFSVAGVEGTSICVKNLKSRPYIDLTLSILEKFGLPIPENRNYETFIFPQVKSPTLPEKPVEYIIEGDWSSAAFLLVAGAVSGDITIKGLDEKSKQADCKILEVLKNCGCILKITPDAINVKSAALNSFHFDATDCPDLFPPLVALAANCTGVSVIKGVSRLRFKESNRAETLQNEFGKLGLPVRVEGDNMIIEGVILKGGSVDSNKDHRIAMACAVAALTAKGNVEIYHAEAVRKSNPSFFEDLKKLGIEIIQKNNVCVF